VDLGEAIYREITNGRSPHTEVHTVGGAIDYLLGAAGGVAAAAARLAGVPASTFRGWLRGRQPKAPGELVGAAQRAQRRERLPRGRERRLRAPGSLSGTRIEGGIKYRGKHDRSEERTIDLGGYIDPVEDELVDAYLDGAPLEDLAEIFHDAISGAPFYTNILDPDDGNEMGFDFDSLDGWA
jgi:transglutaminase-like putative cysteine protease